MDMSLYWSVLASLGTYYIFTEIVHQARKEYRKRKFDRVLSQFERDLDDELATFKTRKVKAKHS
jgi:hypothetical protein